MSGSKSSRQTSDGGQQRLDRIDEVLFTHIQPRNENETPTDDGQRDRGIPGVFRTLVAGYTNGSIKLWNLETGRELLTFRGHQGFVQATVLSPDGKLLECLRIRLRHRCRRVSGLCSTNAFLTL